MYICTYICTVYVNMDRAMAHRRCKGVSSFLTSGQFLRLLGHSTFENMDFHSRRAGMMLCT